MTCTVVRAPMCLQSRPTPTPSGSCAAAAAPGSLKQLRHPSIGERLPAGLAGRAVLQRRVREGHFADRVPAHGAGQTGPAVHGEVALLLALELRRGKPAGPLDSLAEDGPDRLVQGLEVLAGDRGG